MSANLYASVNTKILRFLTTKDFEDKPDNYVFEFRNLYNNIISYMITNETATLDDLLFFISQYKKENDQNKVCDDITTILKKEQ
ncbi:MAG: hypothetical protein LUG60_02255 [Erysipelotrichaceae bacterium]|nr:hypothetical protein [Erysipelotrichaceae bacterium]